MGAGFLVFGLLMLIFNKRVSAAMIAHEQNRLGRLLGSHRGAFSGLYSSRAFRAYARGLMLFVAAFFVVVAIGLMVTQG